MKYLITSKMDLLPVNFASKPIGSSSVTSSPNDLLVHSHSIPYDADLEKFVEEKLRTRSRGTSVNEEVAGIMSKKRRKRKSRNERPYTVATLDNIYSAYKKRKIKQSNVKNTDKNLYNENGILNRKRTRSVSRMEEAESIKLTKYLSKLIKCPEPKCGQVFSNVVYFTLHMRYDHNNLGLYVCDQCSFRYTDKYHLKEHQTEYHDQFEYNCFMCGVEVFTSANLQVHLQNHLQYSVPCNFCDKYFLSQAICKKHVDDHHRGRPQKIRHKKITILDRIDKLDGEGEGHEEELNFGRISPPSFIMIQTGRKNAPETVFSEDLKLNRLRLKIKF